MATKNINPLVLNPDDEFEAVLIDMLKMHRIKSAGYGTESNHFQNFYDSADMANTSPLRECEAFARKHAAALKRWWNSEPNVGEIPKPTKYSNDAMIDRAVYAVIALVLYNREKS